MQAHEHLLQLPAQHKQHLFSFPAKLLASFPPPPQIPHQPQTAAAFEYERAMAKRKRAPTAVVKSLSLDDLRPHFCKPLQEAAAALGISANSLKRTARRLGIPRWPYRGLKGLVRSKKEVVRGMSACGNESEKRDMLRQQYCSLTSREAALRQSGAADGRLDELDESGHSLHPEDGLDALAEAAQAHSVSNDDLSGNDEDAGHDAAHHHHHHAKKKMRPAAALGGGRGGGDKQDALPDTPASGESGSSQAVAAREDSFPRPAFGSPGQRVMAMNMNAVSLQHTKALEDIIQQMMIDQRQLLHRISQLEGTLAQFTGGAPYQHVPTTMRPPLHGMSIHQHQRQHQLPQQPHQQQQQHHQQHHHAQPQMHSTHHLRHAFDPTTAPGPAAGTGSAIEHSHSYMRAMNPTSQTERSPALYMRSYQHMLSEKPAATALDTPRGGYYSVATHMA